MKYADVTGRLHALLPEGPERDELLGFARLGVAFKRGQAGSHPQFLRRYIQALVDRRKEKPSFSQLLIILRAEAYERDAHGKTSSPIEKVDDLDEVVIYYHPTKGLQEAAYRTVENTLSRCKK